MLKKLTLKMHLWATWGVSHENDCQLYSKLMTMITYGNKFWSGLTMFTKLLIVKLWLNNQWEWSGSLGTEIPKQVCAHSWRKPARQLLKISKERMGWKIWNFDYNYVDWNPCSLKQYMASTQEVGVSKTTLQENGCHQGDNWVTF